MKNKKKLLAMSISAVLASGTVGIAMASEMVAVIFKKPTVKYIITSGLSQDNGSEEPAIPSSPNMIKMFNTEVLRFALDSNGNLWEGSNFSEGINSEVWRMTSHKNVTDLSVSYTHALMIKNGDVYAYGKNNNGQLGTGTTVGADAWIASGLSGADSVASVSNHVKGMSFATVGGVLYSVGDNSEKNLGRISTDTCSDGDCALSWSSTSMNNITKILSGAERVLIQNSSGEIYTTDDNNSWVKDDETGLTGLTFGGFHGYGLKSGVVYSYGDNGAGQLGLGNNSPTNQFTATSLSDIKEVRAFVAEMGDGETSSGGYAISNSGELYVVGYNNRLDLGMFPPVNINTWQTNGITDVVSLMNSGREIYLKKSDGHYYYLDDPDIETEPENNIERVQFIVDSDNDGISDQSEIDLGSDPENSGDTPTMILQANNVVTITEDTLFLDDGGLNNYDGSSSSMLSVISGVSGKTVKVSFREFNLSDSGDDYLEIYEGTGTEGYYFEECILNECANKSFISFSDDGSLTFNFETDSDGRWSGWEAMLTLVDKSTLNLTDTDGDGEKDIRDDDDDNDGVEDEQELIDGTDPLDPSSFISRPISRMALETMLYRGENVENVDTSEITDFSYLLGYVSSFTQDISGWDVSNGTNFEKMFYNTSNVNPNISGWDVSSGTNFRGMFYNASGFNQDISGWDVSKSLDHYDFSSGTSVLSNEHIPYAFGGTGVDSDGDGFVDAVEIYEGTDPNDAGSLPKIIIHPSTNTEITITESMSYYDEGGPLRSYNGFNFNTLVLKSAPGKAIKATVNSFSVHGAGYLNMISGSEPYADGAHKEQCQYSCTGTEYISLSDDGSMSFSVGTDFNTDDGWDISITLVDQSTLDLNDYDNDGIPNEGDSDDDNDGITDEQELIDGTNPKDENSFVLPKLTKSELKTMISRGENVTNVDTSAITDFSSLFLRNKTFNQDISGWDVSNGTNFYNMFYGATKFNQNISGWKMHNATNMQAMFRDASEFNQNLNGWNVSKVTNFMNVFYKATAFNGEIKDWDVSNGKEFYGMFRNASAFNKNISEWNMSNATDIGQMFSNATIFNQDIAKWDVSKVTNFYGIFSYTSGMNYDLGVLGTNGGWDVSSGENFGQMFYSNDIYNKDISNWDVSKGTDFYQMFMRTTLFNKDLKGWVIKDGAGFDKFYYESSLQVENVPEEFQ